MSLRVHFKTRDFSVPVFTGCKISPQTLSWSAFGGPLNAILRLEGPFKNVMKTLGMLRCPVEITDDLGSPVWWGFVDRVTLFLEHTKLEVDLAALYNRVRVIYSYLSPDGRWVGLFETSMVEDGVSRAEFGTRELAIRRVSIDADYADNLRDTFLAQHAFPKTVLSDHHASGKPYALLRCSGWFKTLNWTSFTSSRGFYANTSGPGSCAFGNATTSEKIAQPFRANGTLPLQYAFVMLRKVGNPTRNPYATLHADNSGKPAATILATSDSVPYSEIQSSYYHWHTFTFSMPYTITDGNVFWIVFHPNGVDSAHYFRLRTDESMNYEDDMAAKLYNGSGWVILPSITEPGSAPPLIFRFVGLEDTGAQLLAIATQGLADQFFERVTTLTTGLQTCPYRDAGLSCLEEVERLMEMGTSNQRLVLARVSAARHLEFYEQPSPSLPAVFLDQHGVFLTNKGRRIPPYAPPVGQWAAYAGTGGIAQPWDSVKAPTCFITKAVLNLRTGHVTIH